MKHVIKTGAPMVYIQWRAHIRGSENEDYRALQNPEKEELHQTLLREQGWLCAYTMRRIDLLTSHIEHIKPETLCRGDVKGSDLDYPNLVGCYPRFGMNAAIRYGAQEKGSWWRNGGNDFISPLNPRCELQLVFDLKGVVTAYQNNRKAATTIEVLNLNHPSLTDDRKKAIHTFIFGINGADPLSLKKTQQAIDEICTRNKHGIFSEYCVAIRHALIVYQNMLIRSAKKRKFAQAQRKRNA